MTRQKHNREESSHATCNWLEVRNQAAIAAMQGMLSNANHRITQDLLEIIPESAIIFADALVKQLKGE